MGLSKKFRIIRLIILIVFILSCVILIIEAFTPGTASSNKSNFVSDAIAKTINGISEAITKKPKINNLEDFRAFIRKAIGHYGAFLFMAIFATLTAMFYYRYNSWKVFIIKIIIIVLFGFGFAAITELIQIVTPGRAGLFKDVFIDFSGYMTSATIIILIFFIKYFIQYKNRDKKEELE